MPDTFAMAPDGILLIANGIDPMLRWDGFAQEAEPAGVSKPLTAPTLAASGTGTITGTYYAYLRFVDSRGNVSDLSPISDPLMATANDTVTYSGVELPTEPKVARRQILRNTSGQTAVFYIDVDTTDLSSTSFASTNDDTLLAARTPVPLFDSDGSPLANAHGIPPDWKVVVAHHLDRMFATVEVEYDQGSVALALGSTLVYGIGTEWPSNFAGRFLWALAGDKAYEIASVDEASQTLTLTEAWAGSTNPYGSYKIRAAIAERRLVYYSEAGLPESWPAINAISLQEDGDEITALMAKGSFIYIIERKHIYRFTFQSDPATDGYVFLSGNRGCINQRCWVTVDDVAYMLDEAGAHGFSGQESEPLSRPIQDLFEGEPADAGDLRINWSARDLFHASYTPGQEVVRWFVSLSGSYLPRHALCYEIRQKRWWIEEYAHPIGASGLGRLNGRPQVFLGASSARVLANGVGTLDGVDASEGEVRGLADSATPDSITDLSAVFSANSVGAPLILAGGRGKGQRRIITEASATTLRVSLPWLVSPDATTTYQVGGVPWRWRSGYFRWAMSEEETPRRLEVVFDPVVVDTTLDARIFLDRSLTPVVWEVTRTSEEANGFASTAGESDWVGDLTKASGFLQRRIDGHKEIYLDGSRFVTTEIAGVSNSDTVTIYEITVDGASS